MSWRLTFIISGIIFLICLLAFLCIWYQYEYISIHIGTAASANNTAGNSVQLK